MGEIVNLRAGLSDALRAIADEIDDGDYGDVDECTLVLGEEVFHLGGIEKYAAASAIFDLQYGIHKLMNACFQDIE